MYKHASSEVSFEQFANHITQQNITVIVKGRRVTMFLNKFMEDGCTPLCGRQVGARIQEDGIKGLDEPRKVLQNAVFDAIWSRSRITVTLHNNVTQLINSGSRNVKAATFLDFIENVTDGFRYWHGLSLEEIGEIFLKGNANVFVINTRCVAIKHTGRCG